MPLLVVSAYTQPNTISGPISGTPTYPPPPERTHDFGSILKFSEEARAYTDGSRGYPNLRSRLDGLSPRLDWQLAGEDGAC